MIIVLASRYDEAARGLVAGWPAGGAAMMTCEDFLTEGWAFYPDAPDDSVAIAGGRKIQCSSLSGVLTLRPCILEQELSAIAAGDRRYVCAELNAFLIAWLSSLRCRILNRPTATSLSGPNWSPERWIFEAGRLGIPVTARTHTVPPKAMEQTSSDSKGPMQYVRVINGRIQSDAGPALGRLSTQLAQMAGVDYLETRFRNGRMICATCWPDVSRADIRQPVMEYFA